MVFQLTMRAVCCHDFCSDKKTLDEPLKDLVTLLSSLTGPRGKVLIPGFYDAILPISTNEKLLYDDIARLWRRPREDAV